MKKDRIDRAIRRIRQRIFDMPEEKQVRATKAIETLKQQMNYPHSSDYHWMYAAE